MEYEWPGNVRELENIVERMIALSFSGRIDPDVLDLSGGRKKAFQQERFEDFSSLEDYLNKKESDIISWALRESGNNVSNAAKLLKIPRTTLNSKLDRLFPGDKHS